MRVLVTTAVTDCQKTEMREDKLIDYAMPLMKVERFAKKIHDLCLEHKYEEAQEVAKLLIAESRILQVTLQHMKEKHAK